MTEDEKALRARSIVNDEILTLAIEETLAGINKKLLSAKTPEDREQLFHEYHGLSRAWTKLKAWAAKSVEQ